MSTQFNLTKETCLNPYYINGKQVRRIVFFNAGEIIGAANRGWLPMYGSNSSGNTALEALSYTRKVKENLDVEFSYYLPDGDSWTGPAAALYVWTGDLPGFVDKGEKEAMTTAEAVHFGHFVEFVCGATLDSDSELIQASISEVKPREFMLGSYTRSEPTDHGKHVAAIEAAMAAAGVEVRGLGINRMIEHKDAIIAALNGGGHG
jgi:hypothetical protein